MSYQLITHLYLSGVPTLRNIAPTDGAAELEENTAARRGTRDYIPAAIAGSILFTYCYPRIAIHVDSTDDDSSPRACGVVLLSYYFLCVMIYHSHSGRSASISQSSQ